MRGAIWSLVSDVMFPIFWIIPVASILRECTDTGRSLEPVVGNDGSREAKSPGRRRRSSHALAPQHRATVTSVRGHPRGRRGSGSRTGEGGRALKHKALGRELKELRRLGQRDALRWLMGRGQEIQQVIQQIRQVADSNFTILIQGETGTGKELVARSIHQLSARREKPFVALDCGAIPETLIESELFGYEKGAFTGADRRREGHFQLAQGGTLFLDEIVNLPFPTQAKLLRTLEERQVQVLGAKGALPVDVRIVAAANVPMDGEIRAGRFRQDLYYRLNEFVIVVPPFRERVEDIVYLAARFLAEASLELQRPVRGISDEAVQVLLGYHWPGNV